MSQRHAVERELAAVTLNTFNKALNAGKTVTGCGMGKEPAS